MKPFIITLLLIATSPISIRAASQNIYKCGSSYSQTPCPDATVLKINDDRSPAQQKQTKGAALGDKKLAATLEIKRVTEEKRALTEQRAVTKKWAKSGEADLIEPTASPASRIGSKRIKPKTTRPGDVTGELPASEESPPSAKTAKKNPRQD